MYNVFLNNNDPVLRPQDISRAIDEQLANVRRLEQQLAQYGAQQPGSQSPLWDEIDSIVDGLSESERELLAADEEFNRSNGEVLAVLQQEYLRMMRPVVEGSTHGREALKNHLEVVRRLARRAREQTAAELREFREYKSKKQRK